MGALPTAVEPDAQPDTERAPGEGASGDTPVLPALSTDDVVGIADSRGRDLPWRGLVVALLAHGAILGALLWSPEPDTLGGGVTLDAIEVAVVDGRALESMMALARSDGGTETTRLQDEAGEASAAAPEVAPPVETEPKKDEAPAVLTAPEADVAVTSEPTPEPPKPPAETTPQQVPTAAPQAAAASSDGGATARSADRQAEAEAAGTRAPPGVVRDYALSVARVLARNKPAAPGPKGTTRVRFTVGADGQVTDASVTSSSGHVELDQAALAAVKRLRFPVPPGVLTMADKIFDQPFHFR